VASRVSEHGVAAVLGCPAFTLTLRSPSQPGALLLYGAIEVTFGCIGVGGQLRLQETEVALVEVGP